MWRSGCPLLDGCVRRGFKSSYPMGVGFGLWFLKKKKKPSRASLKIVELLVFFLLIALRVCLDKTYFVETEN